MPITYTLACALSSYFLQLDFVALTWTFLPMKNPDLFAGQSQRTKRLHADAKKRLRERKRREWWNNNGNSKPTKP